MICPTCLQPMEYKNGKWCDCIAPTSLTIGSNGTNTHTQISLIVWWGDGTNVPPQTTSDWDRHAVFNPPKRTKVPDVFYKAFEDSEGQEE